MRVGRRRETNPNLPAGVRLIAGRYYWQPTSKREREERKAAGLSGSEPLGAVLNAEARKKWAVLAGFRDEKPAAAGTLGEILNVFEHEGLARKLNGKPRAPDTITGYQVSLNFWRARWGECRYARTAADALAGTAISKVMVQRFLHEHEKKTMANRHVAALSSAFAFAIAVAGLTDYNPCLSVQKNAESPRDREVAPWEAEVIGTVATPLMALMIAYERLTGWREKDVRLLQRSQLTAAGIKLKQSKRGKRQIWSWSDELRAIVEQALAMPRRRVRGKENIESTAVFVTRNGGPLSKDGFVSGWRRTVDRANRILALSGVIDVTATDMPVRPGVSIANLHFHDLRATAGDDAADQGQDRAAFLGDSQAVAERHYARREVKVRPLR